MKKVAFCIFTSIILTFLLSPVLGAQDFNEAAHQSRLLLKAETVLNPYGVGDCLIFPYYDARTAGGIAQASEIRVENSGPNGIVARLRFREWARGKEVYFADIWVPSSGTWTGKVEVGADGMTAVITSSDNVVWRSDSKYFYVSNTLAKGASFSTKNSRFSDSTLCGSVEVIGSEKTMDENIGGKVQRLAKIERDCPNTLSGSLLISRPAEGLTLSYDAVAIGNFSRTQGSLFKTIKSPYPKLQTCEDTLDQLEFQLSKYEIFGPYDVNPSYEGKTTLIITFPTRQFQYKEGNGKRLDVVNNPFEAPYDALGETFNTSLSEGGQKLPTDSAITLPYSVNIIGLYKGSDVKPTGINNSAMATFSSDSGEVMFKAINLAERVLIPDYEYFGMRFKSYHGLPSVGLVVREDSSSGVPQGLITPVQFSADWAASFQEVVSAPLPPSGPTFGTAGTQYTYALTGAASNLGHPIQYQVDWGDGSELVWLDAGVTTASHTWDFGGIFYVRARARCSLHPDIVSKWSDPLMVMMELITPPPGITGPIVGQPNVPYTYSIVGDSVSALGDPVQYIFEWGDTTDSGWLAVGVKSATKTWLEGKFEGYEVKAKARNYNHPLLESAYSPTLLVMIEAIKPPNTPVGPTKGLPNIQYTYQSGGASSNTGDPIEYRFNWGDNTFSLWSTTAVASKVWSVGGDYEVKVEARCAVHHDITAESSALTVKIEKISTPSVSGTATGVPNTPYTYTASGATSNIGDPVQYRIFFSDGSDSGWLAVGVTSVSHSWSSLGDFTVTAKARCAVHTYIESDLSSPLAVKIEVTVTAPSTPTGNVPSGGGAIGTSYNFSTGGSTCSVTGEPVQYQFDWGDTTFSAWLSAGTTSDSHSWSAAGTYSVRAKARCSIFTSVESDWSSGLSVTINP